MPIMFRTITLQPFTHKPIALINGQLLIVSIRVSRSQSLRDEDDTFFREMQHVYVLAVDNHGETIE